MKYSRFEELPVWNAAIEFATNVFALTSRRAFIGQRTLRNQLESAALSISNNVAEGFERGTTQELLTFLYIARGSAGESRSMLCFIGGLPRFSDLKSEISNLRSASEQISRQLRAWADSLQNSPIKGQRYLTDRAQRLEHAGRERDERDVVEGACGGRATLFLDQVEAINESAIWKHHNLITNCLIILARIKYLASWFPGRATVRCPREPGRTAVGRCDKSRDYACALTCRKYEPVPDRIYQVRVEWICSDRLFVIEHIGIQITYDFNRLRPTQATIFRITGQQCVIKVSGFERRSDIVE